MSISYFPGKVEWDLRFTLGFYCDIVFLKISGYIMVIALE